MTNNTQHITNTTFIQDLVSSIKKRVTSNEKPVLPLRPVNAADLLYLRDLFQVRHQLVQGTGALDVKHDGCLCDSIMCVEVK